MTENPYAAPESVLAPEEQLTALAGSGTFVLDRCLSEAWNKTLANIGVILGTGIVATIAIAISYMTVIGIFVFLPVLLWGASRFVLNVHDGRAEFADLFSGFREYARVLPQSLILMILLLLIGLVGASVTLTAIAAESLLLEIVGSLFSLTYSILIMSRVNFSFLFLVDREMTAVEALKASWTMTGPIWGRMILLAIVSYVVGFVGVLALVVGLLISVPLSYLMWISAYRQAAGRPAS